MKKLKTRLLLFILLPTLLFFAGITIYVAYKANEIVIEDAEELLNTHGESLSKDLQMELEHSLRAVQTVSHTFEKLLESNEIPSRYNANVMLQQLLEDNPNVLSTWMYWEENAFDGKDKDHINVAGHDDTGQFVPMWTRNETWGFVMEPMKDYDIPGETQDNLNYVLEMGENYIYEPYTYEADGQERLITSIVAPVTVNGRTIGMSGVNIALDDFNQLFNEFSFYENGFAGLLSNQGNVIAHKNESLIGTDYFKNESMGVHKDNDKVKKAVQEGKKSKVEGFSSTLNNDVYRVFTPVTIEGIEQSWTAFLTAPVDEVKKEASSLMTTVITASVAVIIILISMILWVTKDIVQTLRIALDHGQKIATGDFTQRVSEKQMNRKDELGDITRIFASISDRMQNLIGRVQESSKMVLQSAESLDHGVNRSTSSANEVAASIEDVARSSQIQMQSAEESVKSMEEMTKGVQQVANAATSVSEAANGMTKRANSGQETVHNAVQQMDRIQNETKTTKTVLEQLHSGANEIDNIVSIITEVSEKTNLLALNAAIEAARAGEAGKGFAVVADEVRKLANETKASTLNIQELIQTFRDETVQANQSINQNEAEVNEGIKRIEEVGQTFGQILSSIQEVAKEIEGLTTVAEEMSSMSEEIVAAAEEIASSAETSSSHTQQVAASAEQQLEVMDKMTKTSESLKEMAYELREQISQFKV